MKGVRYFILSLALLCSGIVGAYAQATCAASFAFDKDDNDQYTYYFENLSFFIDPNQPLDHVEWQIGLETYNTTDLTYVFPSEGLYTVTLRIFDENNNLCSDVFNHVNVYDSPLNCNAHVDFDVNGLSVLLETQNFGTLPISSLAYHITGPYNMPTYLQLDSSFAANGSLTFDFPTPGYYVVLATIITTDPVTGETCQDLHSVIIPVGEDQPNCATPAVDYIGIGNQTFQFYPVATAGLLYEYNNPVWSFFDENNNLIHTDNQLGGEFAPPETGTYLVCFSGNVEDADGNPGCNGPITTCQDFQLVLPFNATNCNNFSFDTNQVDDFDFTFTQTVDPPTGFDFINGGWSITDDNGNIVNLPDFPSVDWSFPLAGTYLICLEQDLVDQSGNLICEAQSCETIVIDIPLPDCDISTSFSVDGSLATITAINNDPTPFGEVVWTVFDNGAAVTLTGETITYNFSQPGVYQVCATGSIYYAISGNLVCSDDVCFDITVPADQPNCDDFLFTPLGTYPFDYSFVITTQPGFGYSYENTIYTIADASGTVIHTYSGNTFSYVFPDYGLYEVCASTEVTNTVTGAVECTFLSCEEVEIFDGNSCLYGVTWSSDPNSIYYFEMINSPQDPDAPIPDLIEWTLGQGGPVIATGNNALWQAPGPATYEICAEYELTGTNCSGILCWEAFYLPQSCNIDIIANDVGNGLFVFSTSEDPNQAFTLTNHIWTTIDMDGNQTVGNAPTFTHQYDNPGNYTICLTAQSVDPSGQLLCWVDQCETVVVTDLPNCNSITYTVGNAANPNDPLEYNLDVNAEAGFDYSYANVVWDYFDGSGNYIGNSFDENTTFSFPAPGDYEICITANVVDMSGNVVCTVDHCGTLTIAGGDNCDDYTFAATSVGLTGVVALGFDPNVNNEPNLIEWYLDDGTPIGTGISAEYTFSESGVYDVCADFELANLTCTTCGVVTVAANPLTCNIVLSTTLNDDELQLFAYNQINGANLDFTVTQWDVNGPNGSTFQPTGQGATIELPWPGDYNVCAVGLYTDPLTGETCTASQCTVVQYTIPNNDCQIVTTYNINQNTGYFVAANATPDGLPFDEVYWVWDNQANNDAGEAFGDNVTIIFPDLGTYIVCAQGTYTDPVTFESCTDSECSIVQVTEMNTFCQMTILEQPGANPNQFLYWIQEDNPNSPVEFGPINWTVTGPNGFVITETIPVFDFTFPFGDIQAGTYTICAEAEIFDLSGNLICYETQCTSVTIDIPCSLSFSSQLSGDVGTFTAITPNPGPGIPGAYSWIFTGDNWSGSDTANPSTVTFPENGQYQVCLTIPFIGPDGTLVCEETYCETITISDVFPVCDASFTGGEYTGPNPLTNHGVFENTSTGNYTEAVWDFGDNSPLLTSLSNSVEHTFPGPGLYNVCLTVSDPNNLNDCNDTSCQLITISGITPCQYTVVSTFDELVYNGTLVEVNGGMTPPVIEWYLNGTFEEIGQGQTLSYTPDQSGTYEICVDWLFPNNNCSGTLCETVTFDLVCEDTDCVFPGDTDYDGEANNFDVLPIGLGFGSSGPIRLNATTDWVGQPADDWMAMFNTGINYKHADCDGNGLIDTPDMDAITLNYERTHNGIVATNFLDNPPIWIAFEFDTLQMGPNTIDLTVNAEINIANEFLQAMDIYGVAFSVNYPTELVEPGSVTASYAGGDWFGAPNEVLQLEMILDDVGRIDFGYSRTDQIAVSGFGTIATTSYVITDNLIGFAPIEEYAFNLTITDVMAITHTGALIPLDPMGGTAIIQVDDTSTNTIDLEEENTLTLFPNPANEQLTISLESGTNEWFMMYNMLGQNVMTGQLDGQITEISTRELAIGQYIITIQTESGMVSKKILIQR